MTDSWKTFEKCGSFRWHHILFAKPCLRVADGSPDLASFRFGIVQVEPEQNRVKSNVDLLDVAQVCWFPSRRRQLMYRCTNGRERKAMEETEA